VTLSAYTTASAVIYQDFRALLERSVHSGSLSHYAHMGLEMIREVRKYGPDVRSCSRCMNFWPFAMRKADAEDERNAVPEGSSTGLPPLFPGNFRTDFFMREAVREVVPWTR